MSRRDALAAAAEAEMDRWERELFQEMLRLFDRQEQVVLARLQGPKARKHTRHWDPPGERKVDPNMVLDPAKWVLDAAGSATPIVRRAMTSVYGRLSRQVAERVGARVPSAVSSVASRLEQAIKDRVEGIATGIETAAREVQEFLDREEEAGTAMPEMVTGVRSLYAGRAQTWAERIASTSAVGSVNIAAFMAAQDMGCPSKRWLSRRDDHVRPTHKHADGQMVPLRDPFVLGGIPEQKRVTKLLIPGVPMPGVPLDEVINCRCSMLFSLPPVDGRKDGDLVGVEHKADGGSGDSHVPPDAVRKAAKRGLELRKAHNGRGGTEVGVARARDLASGGGVSLDTCRRMASYFARHEVDKSSSGWGSTANPSAGYIAWLLWGGDAGASWARAVVRRADGEKADGGPLEVKDRVRTAAGAAHYGQPIGSVIRRDPPGSPAFSSGRPAGSAPASPSRPPSAPNALGGGASGSAGRRTPRLPLVDGRKPELAGNDPAVRALIRKYEGPNAPDEATTQVLVVRDHKGRVGGWVAWQTQDGPKPAGEVVSVSVHPALQGRRLGDQLVAAAMAADSRVKPTSRPRTGAAGPRRGGPAAPQRPTSRSTAAPALSGAPRVRSRAQSGDQAGTSGDFKADAARIERLQGAYLRDRVDTTSLFSRGGRFTPAREKQQQAIIDHFLNQPGVKSDRKILVLGGLPGAGKTTTLNGADAQRELGIDVSDYVTVNADEVKEQMVARGMVPDYPGLSADEAATLFHAESFEIAHSLMRQAARAGKNFAYDTSLKTGSQLGFATGAGQRNSPPPWETTLVFVDVPTAVAKQRARDRYLAGGRYMPLGLIDGMRSYSQRHSSGPAEQFEQVKGQADRWLRFDNAAAAPQLVAQGKGGRRARRP